MEGKGKRFCNWLPTGRLLMNENKGSDSGSGNDRDRKRVRERDADRVRKIDRLHTNTKTHQF